MAHLIRCWLVALLVAPTAVLAADGTVVAPATATTPAAPAAATTPAAPAAATTPAAPAAAPTPSATSEEVPEARAEQFDLRVKGLEEHVNDLKERIFRTKARLILLNEKVVGGDLLSGSRAVLVHRNEMGGSFKLQSVTYALDGVPIFTKLDNGGDLASKEEIEIFNGRIVPGKHTVSVRLQYRGDGFGLFNYLKDYHFKLQSNYDFTAEGGKVTTVKVVGFEKGGITTELKERPAIRYDTSSSKDIAIAKKGDEKQ